MGSRLFDAMSRKRQRERPAVDTQLVEIYEDLANVEESIRLKAAQSLLTKFVRNDKAGDDQLREILRRLVRGLCSSRKAARIGFSIALTEYLTNVFGSSRAVLGFHDGSGLVKVLQDETHTTGGLDGQEQRDYLIGRLFGAEAIIKSGVLCQDTEDLEAWNGLLDIVFELIKGKPWIQEQCGFVLYQTLQFVPKRNFQCVQLIIDKLLSNGLAKTPEGIAIWLAIHSDAKSVILPSGVWRRDDPLHRREVSRLAQLLKAATSVITNDGLADEHLQNGHWNANIHFVWLIIISQLSRYEAQATKREKPTKRINFEEFWEVCVDNSLFAPKSSKERKLWGFLLFQRVVKDVPVHLLPSICSGNFMRSLMNQLASPGRYLNRAAEKARKSMLERARKDDDARSRIVEALLFSANGDVAFDSITKTKTAEPLICEMSGAAAASVLQLYREYFLRPGTLDPKVAATRRRIVGDQLLSAMRSSKVLSTADEVINDGQKLPVQQILAILAEYAYFDVEGRPSSERSKPEPTILQSSRDMLRSRISSCLSHLLNKVNNSAFFLYELVKFVHVSKTGSPAYPSLLDVDEGVQRVMDAAWTTLASAHGKAQTATSAPETSFFQSCGNLLGLTILQVHNGDPESVNMLEELNSCLDECVLERYGSEGLRSSAALVEILLGLISKSSLLFRRLSQQVFTTCASDIDDAGLRSMLRVLETKENLSGQAGMFELNNYDDAVDMDNAPGKEETTSSDAESLASSSQSSETSGGSQSQPSSHADEAEGSGGSNEELAMFDAKLAQALGTRPGNEDLTQGGSSSSDEDMDDEQMEAVDKHLEKVFQERQKVTSKNLEKKDAKETIINFKCRVIELLEIFVKHLPTKPLTLSLLMPLLECVRKTSSPQVSHKACNVVREYCRLCKGQTIAELGHTGQLFAILKSIHTEAMMEGSNAHASACSQASLLIVKTLVAHNREHLRAIITLYGVTQEKALFDAKCKIKMSFFTDWLNWCNSARP